MFRAGLVTALGALCALHVGWVDEVRAKAAVPDGKTAIAALDAPGLEHAEVVRVRRDFGNPSVDIALDVWTPKAGSRSIRDVRMWWSDAVDRYPFEALAQRYVAVQYNRLRKDRWNVSVTGDGKRFAFGIGLQGAAPAAYTTVSLPDGSRVRNCRVDDAKLYARRFLGIPVGVKDLVVVCRAPNGEMHRAPVVYQSVGKRASAAR